MKNSVGGFDFLPKHDFCFLQPKVLMKDIMKKDTTHDQVHYGECFQIRNPIIFHDLYLVIAFDISDNLFTEILLPSFSAEIFLCKNVFSFVNGMMSLLTSNFSLGSG